MLTPPDPKRCQADRPNGASFMTCGGRPALYKVLQKGRSPIAGMKWSLPTKRGRKWTPGEWHHVEGPLVRCCNGLHVTSEPRYRAAVNADPFAPLPEVFLVETKGELIGPYSDEWVAASVRLVRPLSRVELRKLGVVKRPPMRLKTTPLLTYLCFLVERSKGTSPRRIGYAVMAALESAAQAGMKFERDDFAQVAAHRVLSLWCAGEDAGERLYPVLCKIGNESALKSFERWKGRLPFVVNGKRLHEGSQLRWGKAKKDRVWVTVTRFDDEAKTIRVQRLCDRKKGDRSSGYSVDGDWVCFESVVVDRFSIKHEDIARREADRKLRVQTENLSERIAKALKYPTNVCTRGVEVSVDQVRRWTPKQRNEVAAYLKDLGKNRWREENPSPPACVTEAAAELARFVKREATRREIQESKWKAGGRKGFAFEVKVTDAEIDAEEARAEGMVS